MFVEDFSTPETEVVVEDEVVKTLRRAADEIRNRGHSQAVFIDLDGQVCMVCAIAHAEGLMNGTGTWSAAKTNLARRGAPALFLADYLGVARGPSLDVWNMEHTKEQVIAALEGAASSRLAALQGKG